MYFSISDGCFYDENIQKVIPKDSVEITKDEFRELLDGRDSGKKIIIGKSGKPQLVEGDKIVPTREEVDAQRLVAYANAFTGSDRYFAEAQRMEVMGEPGWEEVRAEGIKRFEAIQNEFPWPVTVSASDT
ncbi:MULTISPECIES: hypothetical protein [Pseudomonas]|uniref:hypothetical protein n=1 Tax=Pseudomonas TaxID=286 RepID=UPI0018E838AF|nr:hypothetical protein [Pseudomonas haemolytica]MBJ2274790.1 hypothetical protein [Pseudomonas haemolytica]